MNAPAPTRWPDVITPLLRGEDLTAEQTTWAMQQVLSGSATPVQIAGFAVALRSKGETVAEVEGLVRGMYDYVEPIDVPGPTLDVVGTGGDMANTVNISTMAAMVAAGAGVRVVKHGNRAASSTCGAADLVEELGVPLDLEPAAVAKLVDEVGITFCFAQRFHPALRHAGQTRRELGVPTTFNFLGPLANPARPTAQVVGVSDSRMAPIVAGVLARRGTRAWVLRGEDGLDELTTATRSRIWAVEDGTVVEAEIDPVDFGFARSGADALRGGEAAHNARVCRAVLTGVERGPIRDAVLLNAAAGIAVANPTKGSIPDQLRVGLERAKEAIDSGAAGTLLERWVTAARGV